MSASPLELISVRKEFGGLVAVADLSVQVSGGEVVALVGDNGAGKSTVVKMISGLIAPTQGQIRVNGTPVPPGDAEHARDRGIEVVHQDLALADMQPVYMNVFLGRELRSLRLGILDRNSMRQSTEELMRDLDVNIPRVDAPIKRLSGGQRQAVAIARASKWCRSVLLMDEPTAALGVGETKKVEQLIRDLRDRGMAVLLVSHDLAQVERCADRVVVLRRGTHVGTFAMTDVSREDLVAMITGLATTPKRRN